MSSIDALVTAWTARGWLALLAFTAAVLVVAALRKPCRRLFGTERAFQLWLLPPRRCWRVSCRMRPLRRYWCCRRWCPQSLRWAPCCRYASSGRTVSTGLRGPCCCGWQEARPACCWRLWHKRVIAGGCVMPPASWTNVRAGRCCVQPVRTSGPPWSGLGAAASCCRRISNTATTPPSKC